MIISLVWISSFLICLPFVIVQRDEDSHQLNLSSHSAIDTKSCTCTQMSNTPGYIIYSALGSFYIPMIVICYFYFRIYITVRKVASSAHTGLMSMSLLVSQPAMLFTTTAMIQTPRPSSKNLQVE